MEFYLFTCCLVCKQNRMRNAMLCYANAMNTWNAMDILMLNMLIIRTAQSLLSQALMP